MSSSTRQVIEHQQVYVRQANILRKNLYEWNQILRSSSGESWPSMLGRLNAAMNMTSNLDKSIDDVMNHFVYEPRKSTANPADIPFFLSVRLIDETKYDAAHEQLNDINDKDSDESESEIRVRDPVAVLERYEKSAAQLANEFEENMIRFT